MTRREEPPAQTPTERRQATERLLRVHKAQHAQLAAQGDAAVSELAAIAKLENVLESMEAYERINAMTRQGPPTGAS
jgi:hypothetical protein